MERERERVQKCFCPPKARVEPFYHLPPYLELIEGPLHWRESSTVVSQRVQSEGSTKKGTYFSLGCTTKVRSTRALLNNKENNNVFYEFSSQRKANSQKKPKGSTKYKCTIHKLIKLGSSLWINKKLFLMNSKIFLHLSQKFLGFSRNFSTVDSTSIQFQ